MRFGWRELLLTGPAVAVAVVATSTLVANCGDSGKGAGGATGSSFSASAASSSTGMAVPRVPITVTGTTDTHFYTAEHMFATVEMQLAGEPLAQSMGRDLTGYSRDFPVPNAYFMNGSMDPKIDIPGFATAIESYEYSKQPMNELAFESGAGTSFLFAPLVNPTSVTGTAAIALLLPRIQHFAAGSNAAKNFVKTVDGTDPLNRFGWPGFWPTTHPYRSFDPTINAVNTVDQKCSISSDDDPNATGSILNLDYE